MTIYRGLLIRDVMRTLHLALTEGFTGEKVIIHGANGPLPSLQKVTTRMQTGLAQNLDLTLKDGQEKIAIELPDQGIRKEFQLPSEDELFLKVRLESHRSSLDGRFVASHEFGFV